jgi:bifunctional ADP-heptose synthase (sugar kinase/adenylyltransferase)
VDTRNKIITAQAACDLARGREVVLVTGHFDVLLAAHLRELQRVREVRPQAALIVAVTSPPEPVLDARARAEMVAALAVVDYVVSLEGEQPESLLAAFSPDRTVRLEAVHQQRMRELIQHVHRRQSA